MGLNNPIQLLSFKSQANEQHSTRKGNAMTVTITSYYPSGKVMAVKVFTNSIDANEERDYLEKCEFEYSVKWDCK